MTSTTLSIKQTKTKFYSGFNYQIFNPVLNRRIYRKTSSIRGVFLESIRSMSGCITCLIKLENESKEDVVSVSVATLRCGEDRKPVEEKIVNFFKPLEETIDEKQKSPILKKPRG